MRTLFFSTALVLSARVCFAGGGQDATRDQERIQGTWRVVSYDSGDKLPKNKLERFTFVITADKFLSQFIEDGVKGKYERRYALSPDKRPKAIDIFHPNIEGKQEVKGEGIYELEGDNLKLCFATDLTPRPTEFAAKKGTILYVLKRENKK